MSSVIGLMLFIFACMINQKEGQLHKGVEQGGVSKDVNLFLRDPFCKFKCSRFETYKRLCWKVKNSLEFEVKGDKKSPFIFRSLDLILNLVFVILPDLTQSFHWLTKHSDY